MSKKFSVLDVIRGLVCLCLGIVIVAPLLYALSMSVMPLSEIISYPPKIFPTVITLDNYKDLFETITIFRYMLNSGIVAVAVITIQLFTSSLAAFAFAFYDFKFKKTLFMVVLSTMMIPSEAIIISNFTTMSSLGLSDTYLGLILPFCVSAMGIFMLRQNFLTVPKELKEASIIDGCSDLKFYFSILLPIAMPSMVALAMYIFLNTWNQYMWPLLMTNSNSMRTVQIGISMLNYAEGSDYGLITAGCVVVLIPTVLVFLIGGRKLIGGITAGSVKG